jgi:hypothetical protein
MFLGAENQGPTVSGPVLIILVLGGASIFGFGYLWAVMKRANKDYKATKAAVKALRKGFWSSWQAAMKAAFWIFLVFVALVSWVVHDVRAERALTPTPAASTSHKPSAKASHKPSHR